MSLYLLDTNILIDLEGAKASRPFFDDLLERESLRLGTSILCIAEFMSGARSPEGRFLRSWLKSGELEVLYLDALEIALQAAHFRKMNGFNLPDALILSTALHYKAHLLTHDIAFLKKASHFVSVSDPVS
ncbi:MAG: PIN domain-containing protein [Deltaproteobacteria bacterium]|nr:PIN domain-containing protein [Deltaproteobacteria bacterium]